MSNSWTSCTLSSNFAFFCSTAVLYITSFTLLQRHTAIITFNFITHCTGYPVQLLLLPHSFNHSFTLNSQISGQQSTMIINALIHHEIISIMFFSTYVHFNFHSTEILFIHTLAYLSLILSLLLCIFPFIFVFINMPFDMNPSQTGHSYRLL